MSDIVKATFGALELRVPDASERIVEGVVVPWGETSFMTPDPKGERFMAGSLTRSVAERGDRLKLFHSHNHDRAIGRAVEWRPDHQAGCWAQFRIANTPQGDEVLAEVNEGMLDAFSVGFRPIRSRRGHDGAPGNRRSRPPRSVDRAGRRVRRRPRPGDAGPRCSCSTCPPCRS